MYRTFVILRHTFKEAVVQPIYPLLLAIGSAILIIFGMLPFFTLGEDTRMFESVGLDIILLFVLISTLFATSKSIFEEIEDRTMLTLMSKPVKKWEVILGKYLGIVVAALLACFILGIVIALATWLRVPGDYMMSTNTIDERSLAKLQDTRLMHLAGLVPEMVLKWFQISVLAAIGVALSTRVSLVVNLPVVIFVYIAGNLTRFLFPVETDSILAQGIAYVVGTVLPYLESFDLTSLTLYDSIAVGEFATDPYAVRLGTIWSFVGLSFLYAVTYVAFALSAGMLLFQTRELGGAEG
jgi:ABC-type Na+ efflux pump permease subunit